MSRITWRRRGGGRIRIQGLKISEPLSLVRLRDSTPGGDLVPAFCSLLAGNRINLAFLTTACRDDGVRVAGCVAAADGPRLKELVETEAALAGRAAYTRGVGLLTFYPHQSSLVLFGRSLNMLFRSGCRVFAMASSIGALSYVVEYAQIDQAAAILAERFSLDGNHAPFRAEFAVEQDPRQRSEAE